MTEAWWLGLVGGLMIGASAALMFAANGRITGISGILGGLLQGAAVGDRGWRLLFLIGLLAGGWFWLWPQGLPMTVDIRASTPLIVLGGLLVGFGTRRGSGCTSGHGVCGMARLSTRSITATAVFMTSAALTVYLIRHGGF